MQSDQRCIWSYSDVSLRLINDKLIIIIIIIIITIIMVNSLYTMLYKYGKCTLYVTFRLFL